MSTSSPTRKQWDAFLDHYATVANECVFDNPRVDSEMVRAEGMRYLERIFVGAALYQMECHDTMYPQFFRPASVWIRYGAANPDCLYYVAHVDPKHEYRLFGQRGTSHIFDIDVWESDTSKMVRTHNLGGLVDQLDSDDLHEIDFGPNGEFEFLLSQKKRDRNWLPLPENPVDGACYVVIRAFFNDWDNEEAGTIYIERIGATYPPPPETPEFISDRLDAMAGFCDVARDTVVDGAERQIFSMPANSFTFQSITWGFAEREEKGSGYGGQIDGADHYYYRNHQMGYGHFECGEDQAVILEMEAPPTPNWNIYLGSHYWEGLDWHVRMGSINAHQSNIDSDGRLRIVISSRDPGVHNWLDTMNHEKGMIFARFFRPGPMKDPELRVIDIDKVRDELPADTPRVTLAERSEILRKRMHAVRRHLRDFR